VSELQGSPALRGFFSSVLIVEMGSMANAVSVGTGAKVLPEIVHKSLVG
jgi:hypothetical protein